MWRSSKSTPMKTSSAEVQNTNCRSIRIALPFQAEVRARCPWIFPHFASDAAAGKSRRDLSTYATLDQEFLMKACRPAQRSFHEPRTRSVSSPDGVHVAEP